MKSNLGVSYGSAVELGLLEGRLAERPTTAYLFLRDKQCAGMCVFCPQSVLSERPSHMVSRVDWPEFPLKDILKAISLNGTLKRVCVQCSNEELVRQGLPEVLQAIREATKIPISVSSSPMARDLMVKIKEAGADILTVPLDCATDALLRSLKGIDWSSIWGGLEDALSIFGSGRVASHLIVGLGEEEKDLVIAIEGLWRKGIAPYLFAFTPIRGTPMATKQPPSLASYRRLQIARHLIVEKGLGSSCMLFDSGGRISRFLLPPGELEVIISDGRVFTTSGCPDCNRPYYNERVSGPIFNYPRKPNAQERSIIRRELVGAAEGY